VPLALPPPTWLATGVELRVGITATTAGAAHLVRVSPGPETVVAHADLTAGGAATLATVPPADGSYRYRLVLPGEAARTLPLRVRPVRLAAIGDVSPGSALDAVRTHGAAWHWSKVGAWLRGRDVVVANLETAVGTGGTPWPAKNFHFLSSPATIRAMARSGGVDVVTVANNHAIDYGRATFVSGLRTIRRTGMLTAGGGSTLRGALKPAIVERGGLKIAVLGFDGYPPFAYWATATQPGLAPATPSSITRAVRAARARADIVIVYAHWGTELRTRPNAKQQVLARAALRAGADVVLGAHPHVLQPIVTYAGGRLVAYSLGNFVFDPGSEVATHTAALAIDLGRDGVIDHRLRRARIVESRPLWR
jgi:poly-gamma-glutamate capsule biosynthesis protein CapA/YwtB (metallophosphatase superfamily)